MLLEPRGTAEARREKPDSWDNIGCEDEAS